MDTETTDTIVEKKKSRRGFASMSPEKVAELARKGGKAAWASGHAHKFTKETAKIAGRKGGKARSLPKPVPASEE